MILNVAVKSNHRSIVRFKTKAEGKKKKNVASKATDNTCCKVRVYYMTKVSAEASERPKRRRSNKNFKIQWICRYTKSICCSNVCFCNCQVCWLPAANWHMKPKLSNSNRAKTTKDSQEIKNRFPRIRIHTFVWVCVCVFVLRRALVKHKRH